jgi:putative FmdB family regulatory protein
MPRYEYECADCGGREERVRPTYLRDGYCMCSQCDGSLERVFTPTAAIAIPAHFGKQRGWHLPPKESPEWAHMQPEGSGHKKRDDRETLEDAFRKAGLIR